MTDGPANEIAIPANTRILGEFIAELLGQRRSIERSFADRHFEIDMAWLLNLDQIIEQRLAAQNEGRLMSFSARFYFANGKIIILEGQSAFRSFNDMSNDICVGVDLRWTYLIKFPLAKLPEKQEIRFLAFTDRDALERKTENGPSKSFMSAGSERELLSYEIQFTDVTWGEDMSGQITNYVLSKTDLIPKWKHTLRRLRSSVLFPLGLLLGSMTMALVFMSSLLMPPATMLDKYKPLNEIARRLNTDQEKLDFLVTLAAHRLQMDGPFLLLLPLLKFILAMAIIIGIFFVLLLRKASFICINETSRRYLDKHSHNFEFIKYGIGAALVVGTLGGIFANRIYDAIRPLWE